jgi:hypothetical protein
MTLKLFIALLYLSMLTVITNAKTFNLKSSDQTRSFSLSIYCTPEGKAAYVQYEGQKGFLSLRLKKFTRSALTNTNKHPEGYYYEWDEILNGKITGSYAITEHSGGVTEAWYFRNKDRLRFKLIAANKEASLSNVQKYLLHGVLITFTWTSTDSLCLITLMGKL